MLKGFTRQAGSVSTTLLGPLALTFFMGRMLPNDPVLAIVGDQADQTTYDMVHHQLELDQPLYVQFFLYMRSMLSGDFGNALFRQFAAAGGAASGAGLGWRGRLHGRRHCAVVQLIV